MAQTLIIEPVRWALIEDAAHVRPLTLEDFACLDALRNVLQRHGAGERFGVQLLGRHFEMADDEVLVELADRSRRTLSVQAMKRSDVAKASRLIETQWRLDARSNHLVCSRCFRTGGQDGQF